ncbi:hypothetical protein [Fodinibius sp. Rm-B-1B1-1]|uniref:hypothetical protein n=1 Tax=Fodinibius alkaliphilus TaxID=3140241 RepID=UPI00315A5F0A
MSWLKDVIVDLLATGVIVAAVLTSNTILSGLVWGYTGLLLFTKLLVYFGDGFMNMMNKTQTSAPDWFTHLLYAINTATLLGFQWWYAGVGWAIIWMISFLTQRKLDQK